MTLRRLTVFALLLLATSAYAVDPALFQDLHWRLLGPFRGGRVLAVSRRPRASRSISTSAASTAGCGRRATPAGPGIRSSTASRSARSARSPSRPPIRESSTSGRARRTCAPTSPRATVSTSRPTAAGRGPRRSRDTQQIGRILVDPSRPGSRLRRRARPPVRAPTRSAACSAPRTAAAPGKKVLQAKRRQRPLRHDAGPSTWPSSRATRTSSTPRCGRRAARPGASIRRRTGRAAACTTPRTAATAGRDRRRRLPGRAPGRIGAGRGAEPARPRLRHRRRREGRPVPLRRRRRHLDARQRRPARLGARMVLRRRQRRAEESRRGLLDQHQRLPIRRRRGRRSSPSRARRAATTTTSSGSIPIIPSAASSASTREPSSRSTAARTWSSWYNQPTGQFYHVITDNRFPYWVYGAQQDSGAAGIAQPHQRPSTAST